MAKIVFKTPLKPDCEEVKEVIHCPNCNSRSVYVHALVVGYAYVNVNSYEVDESPDECDVSDIVELREINERICRKCGHAWEIEKGE